MLWKGGASVSYFNEGILCPGHSTLHNKIWLPCCFHNSQISPFGPDFHKFTKKKKTLNTDRTEPISLIFRPKESYAYQHFVILINCMM